MIKGKLMLTVHVDAETIEVLRAEAKRRGLLCKAGVRGKQKDGSIGKLLDAIAQNIEFGPQEVAGQ